MKSAIVSFIIALALAAMGIALAVYAEADDSPGGVLIGMLLVAGAAVIVVKVARRAR